MLIGLILSQKLKKIIWELRNERYPCAVGYGNPKIKMKKTNRGLYVWNTHAPTLTFVCCAVDFNGEVRAKKLPENYVNFVICAYTI